MLNKKIPKCSLIHPPSFLKNQIDKAYIYREQNCEKFVVPIYCDASPKRNTLSRHRFFLLTSFIEIERSAN